MVLSQSFWVGVIGISLAYPCCLGLRYLAMQFNTDVDLRWEVLLGTTVITISMALIAGLFALRSIFRLLEALQYECARLGALKSFHLMSALPPKADIAKHWWDVRFVPKADIRHCSKTRPVRLYDAALFFRFWRGRKAHEMRSDAKPSAVPPLVNVRVTSI